MKYDRPQRRGPLLNVVCVAQESARYRGADFVHGDPVFSNCLLNKVKWSVPQSSIIPNTDVKNTLDRAIKHVPAVLASH